MSDNERGVRAFFVLLQTVTAVSGVLVAFGFLALRARANSLGVSSFLHHGVDDYLEEGGVFVLITLFSAASSLGRLVVNPWFTGAALLSTVIGWRLLGSRARVRRAFTKRRLRRISWVGGLLIAWAFVILLVPAPPQTDLLFDPNAGISAPAESKPHDHRRRQADYAKALSFALLTAALWWSLEQWDRKSAVRAFDGRAGRVGRAMLPAALIGQSALLPINYGASVMSERFHVVRELVVASDDRAVPEEGDDAKVVRDASDEERLFIGTTDEWVVLYDVQSHNLEMLPRDQVEKVVLGPRRRIAAPVTPGPDEAPGIQDESRQSLVPTTDVR